MPNPPQAEGATHIPLEVPKNQAPFPQEGDTITTPTGDKEVYKNGTWIVHVAPNPNTGQDLPR